MKSFLADDLLDVPEMTVTAVQSIRTPPPAPAPQHVSSSRCVGFLSLWRLCADAR